MRKTIVIVETDRSILEILILALTDEGHTVRGTLSFSEAPILVAEELPILVIIEYKLKGLEAISLCKKFKKEYPEMLMLAISCNMDIKDTYHLEGFDDFISKPFELNNVFESINFYLNQFH